jgi:hypothetical protein
MDDNNRIFLFPPPCFFSTPIFSIFAFVLKLYDMFFEVFQSFSSLNLGKIRKTYSDTKIIRKTLSKIFIQGKKRKIGGRKKHKGWEEKNS